MNDREEFNRYELLKQFVSKSQRKEVITEEDNIRQEDTETQVERQTETQFKRDIREEK